MWISKKRRLHKLADAIRSGDVVAYQHVRYPAIQDGADVSFWSEDFSNTDFSSIGVGFFIFNRCNLHNARGFYRGVPITIRDSNAQAIDLRGTHTIIEAYGSDFRGMLFDKDTVLADRESIPSRFTNCIFDSGTERRFREQGVVFE